MKKFKWVKLVDDNNIHDFKILKYPRVSKDRVVFEKDGEIFEQKAETFIKGHVPRTLISKMYPNKQKLTESEILEKFNDTEFKLIEGLKTYQNSQSDLIIEHIICGRTFTRTLGNFNQNKKCPLCYMENREPIVRTKSHSKFLKDVKKEFGEEYQILGRYIGARDNIEIKHNKCGTIYSAPPGRFLREKGYKCPKCTGKSIGEFAIDTILSKMDIDFIREARFEGLEMERPLQIDFYIPEYNV